jgi:3-oxoacyl-[acyl-carrier protein] reductase
VIATDLTGRRALVTGGASGIGLATVAALLRCGAAVAVNHLPEDGNAPVVLAGLGADGGRIIAAPGDVSVTDDAERMVRAAIASLGGLDLLVNNAATAIVPEPIRFDDLAAMTDEFWRRTLETNLVGAFRCIRAAVPALRESRGTIVNMASVAAFGGAGNSLAYGASKAGLVNLTRSLGKALAPEIRVNAIAPGITRTPWTDAQSEASRQLSISRTVLERIIEPEEVADAVLFVAAAPSMTGHTLVIDAGRNL